MSTPKGKFTPCHQSKDHVKSASKQKLNIKKVRKCKNLPASKTHLTGKSKEFGRTTIIQKNNPPSAIHKATKKGCMGKAGDIGNRTAASTNAYNGDIQYSVDHYHPNPIKPGS